MAHVIPQNFRSNEDVDSSIARVCTALQNGLDDSCVVWVEPPFDADGSKPHLVVLLPEHGVATIEVLDVRSAKLLGSLRGKVVIERDRKQVEDDPLRRAETYAQTLRERITGEPRLAGQRFPVAACAALPSLDETDAKDRGLDESFVRSALFREALESAIAGDDGNALERWFARRLGVADPIEGSVVDLMRGLIQPNLVIDSDTGADQLVIFRSPNEEDVVRVMDRRQEALAKGMAEGHRVVRGVAGSGKTLVLVYRARLFAEMYPEQRFLVACYTRSLASQLKVLLGDHENIEVVHLDKLKERAIKGAGLSAPTFTEDPTGDKRADIALKALERGALPRYRAVFLDEAQDFGTVDLAFARTLTDSRHDDLLVVADAAQNVFRKRFSWKQAGINAQGRTRILRVNYRNTREILELASGFLLASSTLESNENPELEDENAIVPPRSAARAGSEPTVTIAANGSLVGGLIEAAGELLGDKPAPKRLALLYLCSKEGRRIARALDASGVEYFWVTDPDKSGNKDGIAATLAPVVLSTVQSAKGLEFPAVLLSCTPPNFDFDDDGLRMLIYVGMTRATEELAVFADEAHPLVDDLRAAAESKGRLVLGIQDD